MAIRDLLGTAAMVWLISYGPTLLAQSAQTSLRSQSGSPATQGPSATDNAGRGVTPSSTPQLQRRDVRYRLQISDVIQIDFPLSPEFGQTVTVQPDGYISLRSAGDVKVLGQTLPELTQTLRRAYRMVLHEPVINVDLKDYQRPYFVASGFVNKPGKYELREDTTVTEALAIAGGLSQGAKHSQVLLFHKVSDNWAAVKKLDVKHMLQSKDLSEDVHLQPGDMLYVPQSRVSKVRPYVPLPTLGIYGPRL
jgi:polysaccharide biosynthesis/export protein